MSTNIPGVGPSFTLSHVWHWFSVKNLLTSAFRTPLTQRNTKCRRHLCMEHFLSPSQCEADIPGDIRNGNHCRGRIFQLAICDLQENGMCCMLLKTIVLGLRERYYLPSKEKEREGSSFSNHGHNKIQNVNNSNLLFFSKFCLCKFATFVSYLTLTRL